MTPGEANISGSQIAVVQLDAVFGKSWVTGGRLPCFRPARLVAKYSHTMPRFAHRAQVGFSLLHLSLDAAQRLQLSRSLGPAGAMLRRAGGVRGDCTVVIDNEGDRRACGDQRRIPRPIQKLWMKGAAGTNSRNDK